MCAAVLTPVDEKLRPDAHCAVPYYRQLLENGCDALNVLGTTGEAMSLSTDDRLRFMESIAGSDLPRECMMVGTGAAALGDAVRMTSAAFRLGFRAALVMPPFFFRDVSDDGVVRYFDLLLDAVDPPDGGIFLYNFPQVSGIRFHAGLVDRLMETFPGIVGGIKDSSNDVGLQRQIRSLRPELAIFPSSEAFLAQAREEGFAGCISGSVALWPEIAAAVWRGETEKQSRLSALRKALSGVSLIGAVRYFTAQDRGENDWERCIPPLAALTEEQRRLISAALEQAGYDFSLSDEEEYE